MYLRSKAVGLLLCGLLVFLSAGPSRGADYAEQRAADNSRLRVGLVLGGGGARGAAHVGVLRELERMRIPVDAIAGTSMGAIVGGLYATGMNAAELEEIVSGMDWESALSDTSAREELSFRRKQDDKQYPMKFEVGFRDGEFQLPDAVLQGQKLDLILRQLTHRAAHIHDFDRLPIPFRAIASDIERAEAYVLREGDLAMAIRASMSVPGVFSPVRLDGRLLLDGGIVGNLPVDVMRTMGVDVIIAVDVEFPLYTAAELESVLTISEQMLTILIRKETRRQIDSLQGRDVLIRPELGLFASTNFADSTQTIDPGAAATRAQADKLRALALDESAYAGYRATVRQQPAGEAVQEEQERLAFVRVVHDGRLSSKVLESRLASRAGDPLDPQLLAADAGRLYGLQLYEKVDYRLLDDARGTGVEFAARGKSWGPNIMQFGVALEDDFEGSSAFNVATRITRGGLNRLGAEWRTDLQLGTNPLLYSEFYQPLSFDSRFFLAPGIRYEQGNLNAFAGEDAVARFRVSRAQAGIDAGFELGRIGELRGGVFTGRGEARVKVGDPSIPNIDFDSGGVFAQLRFDTLDNAHFPRHGKAFDLRWTGSRTSLGADTPFDTIEADFESAWSRGKSTLLLGLSYATILEPVNNVQEFFPMGGFLRLSGLERGAVSGPHAALARLVLRRRVGSSAGGLFDTPVFLGASLEAGNVWQNRSQVSHRDVLTNGSLFAGMDTFLGPVYLAAGLSEGGRTNFYLFIGAAPR